MSDREIFIIGVGASVLILIHVAVNILQFRKIGRESDEMMRRQRERRDS